MAVPSSAVRDVRGCMAVPSSAVRDVRGCMAVPSSIHPSDHS